MSTPVRVAPSANVDAAPAQPPATGLISLARSPAITNDRWMAGYSYVPELPGTTIHNLSLVTSTRGDNIGTGEVATAIETMPWMLEVEKRISSFVSNRDSVGEAARLLEAYSSKLLERELWTGEIAQADDLPNRFLAKEAEVISGTFNPQAAVAALVGAMAEAGMGDCMIHAPKHLGIQLPDGWRNNQTYEDHGFVVVAGAGYPGTAPLGNADTSNRWMYATEIVNVRLGPIEVLPGNMNEAFDTRTNEITYYAQRVGAADFAGPVFACLVA